jgi:hypothetical protein
MDGTILAINKEQDKLESPFDNKNNLGVLDRSFEQYFFKKFFKKYY